MLQLWLKLRVPRYRASESLIWVMVAQKKNQSEFLAHRVEAHCLQASRYSVVWSLIFIWFLQIFLCLKPVAATGVSAPQSSC